ncbi:MAG: hypothetical protein UHD09_00665, partial [Bifidobacterium sp.]|nr:hypothetical protein [Bifidobacterium sp.]
AQPAAGQQPRVAYAASQRQPQPMPQQYTQPEAAQGEQPVLYRASPASAQQYPQEMAQPARPQATSRYTAATPDAAVTVESAGQSAQPASFEPGTMSLPDIPSIPPLTVPGTGEEVVDEHVEVTETEPTQPAQQTQPKQSGKE